jgi:hypothetical protein
MAARPLGPGTRGEGQEPLITLLRKVPFALRWTGAFDEDVLERCPTEKLRATATGVLVIVVGAMAGGAATLTGHNFLHLALVPSVAFGLCWALAIMSLDRWLLLVIKRQRTKVGTLALAAPRVALAVIAGLVIAKALVLGIFNREVTHQAHWDTHETVISHLNVVDRRDNPPVDALTQAEHRLQTQLGTVGTSSALSNDPPYQQDIQRANLLSREANAAFNKAQCELDGTCGTSHVGAGPVYDRKLKHAQSLQEQANAAEAAAQARAKALNSEQQSATDAQHAAERHELASVVARLHAAIQRRAQDEQTVRVEYGGPIGLADRLDALSVIERIHGSVGNYALLLTLLLALVDSAPALGKALMLMGANSAYETELDSEENAAHEMVEMGRDAEKRACEISTQEIVDQANAHREQWQDALPEIVSKIIAVQRSVTEEAIERWERDIRARIEAGPWAAETTSTQPPQHIATHGAEHRRPRGRRRR